MLLTFNCPTACHERYAFKAYLGFYSFPEKKLLELYSDTFSLPLMRAKLLPTLSRRKDRNTLNDSQVQQIRVTANKEVCFS